MEVSLSDTKIKSDFDIVVLYCKEDCEEEVIYKAHSQILGHSSNYFLPIMEGKYLESNGLLKLSFPPDYRNGFELLFAMVYNRKYDKVGARDLIYAFVINDLLDFPRINKIIIKQMSLLEEEIEMEILMLFISIAVKITWTKGEYEKLGEIFNRTKRHDYGKLSQYNVFEILNFLKIRHGTTYNDNSIGTALCWSEMNKENDVVEVLEKMCASTITESARKTCINILSNAEYMKKKGRETLPIIPTADSNIVKNFSHSWSHAFVVNAKEYVFEVLLGLYDITLKISITGENIKTTISHDNTGYDFNPTFVCVKNVRGTYHRLSATKVNNFTEEIEGKRIELEMFYDEGETEIKWCISIFE